MARRKIDPMASEEALAQVAARFRALGDSGRLKILRALMEGEASVGEIMEAAELPQTAVSRHLAVLRSQGIVQRRGDGNRAYYRIVDPSVKDLCTLVCDALVEQRREQLKALRSGVG